ncbi:Nucleotide exchange factor Sil1 [Pseudolycoriella hygida]|uniref:Nucleotide exchange factor SIL1 n=1 Tax=Pseudolycoriella hygida TaxID=35572 RepID=A0A9Q0RU57_9DIPT|nr:Nucleotide exchange factor Sil1 [Pseudolycoriella hygida]
MKLRIIILFVVSLVNSNDVKDEVKVFNPTREWKEIPEGHSIPAGLHVRINLQTGKKEAKLLDPSESSNEKYSAIVQSSVSEENEQEGPSESIHSRLKDALKNIPDEGIVYSEDELKDITKKLKTYEAFKQEFDDMNIKTDFEMLSDLLDKYETIKHNRDVDAFNILFEDLEYLLHQIDNANDFVTAGGLDKVILPNLRNQSIPELRIHSVKLLGILVQNNPKGQIAAFERNAGSHLLQLLNLAKTSSTAELSSIIYALGGLLREFPLAQEELLKNPGLNVLVDLLGKQVDYKIKIKCLLLLTDLIRDDDEVTERRNDSNGIKNRLSKTAYCEVVVHLLQSHRQDYLESVYVTEDILSVLIVSKEICKPTWADSSIFRQTLMVIKSHYDQVIGETREDDGELSEVVNKLEKLQAFFSGPSIVKSNDEL